MQLLGNVLSARLLSTVISALEAEVLIKTVTAWTDSQAALGWIQGVRKEYHTCRK